MESYIVRIHRRDEQDVHPVRGIVEQVGAEDQDAFGTMQELWNILSVTKRRRRKPKKSTSPGREVNKKQGNSGD
ncbi:MAG: hypothetical protein ACE5GZ_11195 [Gammaproteobacteria bacterium]